MLATLSSKSNTTSASTRRKPCKLYSVPYLRGHSNRFNSTQFMLLPLSKRNDIGTSSSSSIHSSNIHFDYVRNLYQYHRPQRRPQLQSQWRSHSSDTDTDDHANEKNNCNRENKCKGIAVYIADILLLEKAAFTAKEIVELRVSLSIETAVWKSSTATERKKMCRFFFPQLRKATDELLGVTRDVDSLSHLIEETRENNGCNASGKRSLRELHCSFLNLTQIVLDNFDVAMELEGDQYDDSQDDSVHSLRVLELVLALSHRAHQLGLGYHRPLYQRLAVVMAKHPKIIEGNVLWTSTTTLGSLASHSRAEWIQTVHRWSRFTWGGNKDDSENQNNDNEDQLLILKTKHEDLKWFHPSLKVLAANGRWSDVYHILLGLLRPKPEPMAAEDDINSDRGDGHDDNYLNDNFDDTVVLTSATRIPYLDEDLVFDLLVPMNQQGMLRDMWNNRGLYSPSKSVEENIVVIMEASIWKIFHTTPIHLKATIHHEDKEYSETYSLQDAIGILLKCGPMNLNEGIDKDDNGGGEYLSDENEVDSLAKALRELEDLLDEHLDLGKDDEIENDGMDQKASEAIALATTLSNQMRREGAQDSLTNNSGDLNSLNLNNVPSPSDKTKASVGRSYSDHIMETTSVNETSYQSTDNYLHGAEGEECIDFIYDDRAVDYEDNVPDIMKQIYQNNGNQELRYTTSLENNIYEGMQRSTLHYDSEDDEDDLEF